MLNLFAIAAAVLAVVLMPVAWIHLGLAAYHLFRLQKGLSDPRHAWLLALLIYSDRPFTEEGASDRRLFFYHFVWGLCVSAVVVLLGLLLSQRGS